MAASAAAGAAHTAAGALWTTQSKAAAEAATLTAAGFGSTLWKWNRAYYSYDAHQRWARFNFINNMAIGQTGQYREDITDLCELTSTRMENYQILGVMALTINTALFCPGRLGLHTPPPASWLMGLEMANVASAYLWLAMTMWLAMHASLRADSTKCHMLTRMVRLPVPSIRHLDRARRLFSSYEYQNFGELFRIPFIQRHAYSGSRVTGDEPPTDAEAKNRTRCEYDVPDWFCRERNIDEGRPVETMMPCSARAVPGTCPEHFEVFRVIQNEYWPFDIYARICMFLSWMHLTSGWGYYQMGHVVTETRAIFAAVLVPLPIFTLQNAMITLDIKTPGGEPPLVRAGPCGLLFALFAQVLEHKRWYSDGGLYGSAVLVFCAHFCQIIYVLSLLRLCCPDWDSPSEIHESPGAAWWPAEWALPKAWHHAVWLVAPPKQRAHGENDIVDELRRSSALRNGDVKSAVAQEKKEDVHRALGTDGTNPAWGFVKAGLLITLVAWIWLTVGYLVDITQEGTTHPSLISAPGLPNHLRDPRTRPPKPGYLCTRPYGEDGPCFGQEVGTGGYYAGPVAEQVHRQIHHEDHGGGFHRRLQGDAEQRNIGEKIRDLLPYLKNVVEDRDDSKFAPFGVKPVSAIETAASLVPARAEVQWPPLFEPRLLACGPSNDGKHMAAVLSRQGRGALITSGEDSTQTTPFVLEGAALLGPFLAAHWDESGLILTTATGGIVECPGTASSGRWACHTLATEKLPLGLGSEPFAGALAVARRPSELVSAVVFPGEPTVAIFRRSGESWLPAGEARTPSQVAATAFHDNGESLLMLLTDGAVVKMRLSDGAMAVEAEAVSGPAHTWQATCGLTNNKVARLGVTPSGPARWEPSLILGA